jgi:hypothetical protein
MPSSHVQVALAESASNISTFVNNASQSLVVLLDTTPSDEAMAAMTPTPCIVHASTLEAIEAAMAKCNTSGRSTTLVVVEPPSASLVAQVVEHLGVDILVLLLADDEYPLFSASLGSLVSKTKLFQPLACSRVVRHVSIDEAKILFSLSHTPEKIKQYVCVTHGERERERGRGREGGREGRRLGRCESDDVVVDNMVV